MARVDGGPVVAHAQAFADEINRRFGFTHIMTYDGHQPTKQRALDCFHTREQMYQMAMWAIRDDVIAHFGIDYVIHDIDPGNADPGEIYNPEIARRWRQMQNRGGPTQNHYDHVHVSFNPTAAATPAPAPQAPAPQPSPKEDDMVRLFRNKGRGFIGVIGAWYRYIETQGEWDYLVRHGVPVNNTDGTVEIQDDVFGLMVDLLTLAK